MAGNTTREPIASGSAKLIGAEQIAGEAGAAGKHVAEAFTRR